ncbi:hypothetical protein MSAN_01319100 [Mycena sanguinolenta]|uniref:G domain-containing protein n=1 Tax=Mycena sanguinolenta TaxID=230812 RepID=A0A8H6YEI8_9AGAR|nr:hypothetical protein MSAN_01319100 [Mycena sanguinolenta]
MKPGAYATTEPMHYALKARPIFLSRLLLARFLPSSLFQMSSAEDTTSRMWMGSVLGSAGLPPTMVAVLGSAGTGKSSFIRLVTNDDTIHVRHSQQSDTSQIVYTECFNDAGGKLTLIDTPGFDDSEGLSDVDILRMIGDDLHSSESEYGKYKLLSGVIYMYNIANTRSGGVDLRTIRMLENLVGPGGCEHVVLVTTMWETVGPTDGERREAELKSDERLFKLLINAGAKMIRHDSGPESARRIIDAFLMTDVGPRMSAAPKLLGDLDRADGAHVEGARATRGRSWGAVLETSMVITLLLIACYGVVISF